MSLANNLAQELVDAILDFLHDDRSSLCTSALVARRWLPASRYHIFQRITLNNVFSTHRVFRDSAQGFLDLCDSPHCSIVSSIQDVILDLDHKRAPTGLRDIVRILSQAPISRLEYVDRTFSEPTALSWISPNLSRLQQLSYYSIDQFSKDIFPLVAHFPELRTLSISCNATDSAREYIPINYQPLELPAFAFTHLRNLRLCLMKVQTDEFMRWLGTFGHRIQLEELDVDGFHFYHNGWGPIESLNAFLASNGSSLTHFGLYLRYEYGDSVDDTVLLSRPSEGDVDLSPLINLRTLKLGTHNIDAVCASLNSLPIVTSPLVEFELSYRYWIHYHHAPCTCQQRFLVNDLAESMARDQFAKLRNFTIVLPAVFGDGPWDWLREFFPRWNETDVLQIVGLSWEEDY
ncbi:hypothetical protein R3P38DRAFT_2609354 [Favolaschia claudopus]|uniref:F-box domain-containing protein n=1 Tax=Favolaschia claudopus TaxID=2862362 RepID=A0AAW0D1V7_9AGAR